MPIAIIAGALDRLIDTDRQSARLGQDVAHSTFRSVPGAGHMVHQTATDEVMAAIDEAAKAADDGASRIVSIVSPAAWRQEPAGLVRG